MKEKTILIIAILALLLLVAGLMSSQIHLMPQLAAGRAVLVDQLFRTMLGIATIIFLIVEGALIYAVLRFRRRKGDEADATPSHGNDTLELVWTLIPAVIVVAIGFQSFRVLSAIEVNEEDPLVIEVIGRQFTWQFRYPEVGLSTAELHLPVGVPVRFEITSEDVIHSFWIPNFLAKRDATPGRVSELVVTPTEIGRFPVRCAELCGPGHAVMNAEVVVESQAAFDEWLAAQLAPPASTKDRGRELFSELGCGACHTLSDAGAEGVLGPSLDGLNERAEFRLDGLDAEAYVKQSILEPDAFIVESFQAGIMISTFGDQIGDEELQILTDYLLER